MPDTFNRTTALRLAQQHAFEHARTAQEQHDQALTETKYADERADNDYMRTAVAEARQRAQHHNTRSNQAGRLAEMWARVSTALATSPDGTDTAPTAYDLTVQLDPNDVTQTLARRVHTQRQPGTP
ncbi:hypothetical protein SZN_09306 [Streptomyces zinciresistens K42]|uniref:Uncharacterized protein n=1 Tax=Streptomyces zinciresistens K42 TaxID=700597 RepID=G2G8P3_9ACTN|nr:hypothetical protein [Streptomyces zinciresistens]EGX60108.1 hypothetical protein SZN_09306 [Streptomyces zinciresistens K42]